MPQPYKKRPDENISISPRALEVRRDLAFEIALVAAHWSQLELRLSKIFCALVMRQERGAFDIYHAIRDRDLRKNVLLAAGKGVLSQPLRSKIQKLYSDIRKVAPARSAVVHGLWAVTDRKGKENVLLLCEERTHNENFSTFLQKTSDNLFFAVGELLDEVETSGHIPSGKDVTERALAKLPDAFEPIENFVAYTARDFKFTRTRIEKLVTEANNIGNEVWNASTGEFARSLVRRARSIQANSQRAEQPAGRPNSQNAK